MMRSLFTILFIILIAALLICVAAAKRSHKAIGSYVAFLICALIPPVTGNLIIISSEDQLLSTVGCYIYYLGMDVVMLALLQFTFQYCRIQWPNKTVRFLVYALLAADAIQLLCNPFFGHAFSTERILVDSAPYYRLIPYAGQTFHRIVDYGIFVAVLLIFLFRLLRAPSIYSEKYSVILLSAVLGGCWQSYYIFSRTPVDSSMIGFAVFGILIFYFSLIYRPFRLLDRMLANIASELPEAVFSFDRSGQCIWANQPGMELAGVTEENLETVMETLTETFGELDSGGDWCARRVLGGGSNASYYALEKHGVTDDHGRQVGSFLTIRNITEEQRILEAEKYNARHDRLTDLYTKEHLYESIQALLREHPDTDYAIVYIDVKDFKIVNDIFGNEFGDFALCSIADWLRAHVPPGSVYGRLGGDMFGVCIPVDAFDPEAYEKELFQFIIRDKAIEHSVLIHLGVYEITEKDLEVSVMFDRARLALSSVKDEYQTHVAYYDDEMRQKVLWEQHISTQLLEAIEKRQIVPYLQPIVDQSGKVAGAEALVRWIHPVDGFLSPAAFIPVFEKNGMIAEVDKYMWRCACEILAEWKEIRSDLFLSVNISPKDFYFMDVGAELRAVVREYGINPAQLRVEITETVMMTDIENRIKILTDLRNDGFLVEMDDFGSGYSSLNLLKDMPVDIIKIDMMFLRRAKDNSRAQTILHNIIDLSEDLGISSLTEGVETEAQYQMLAGMDCKYFQGYYFAKPMPVEEFAAILK